MIIVKLQGGLGNQLFQYAIARSLARQRNCSFYLDHRFLDDRTAIPGLVFRHFDLDIFGIPPRKASKKQLRFFFDKWPWWKARGVQLGLLQQHSVIRERHFHYDALVPATSGHLYLDGYWQSASYFAGIDQVIRDDFKFKRPLLQQSASLLQQLDTKELVCINVRRSDFLTNSFHPVCGLDYFIPAIEMMASKLDQPHFLVFSDDVDWCRQNFSSNYPLTIIDHSHKGEKFDNYLLMMSCCKHFIIPNSSFAWWAVWLANQKDNLVIAPQQWFSDPAWNTKDLVPASWIRLPNN